jgi:radical SAM superfamily enzyme YgiQ (UPF0313 family)
LRILKKDLHSPLYRSPIDTDDFYQSPIPRYDLVSKYKYTLIGVQTTRGCPYRCEYCNVANIFGEKYKHKPIEQVVEEIKIVKNYWPDSMFYFLDDNLFADRKYAIKLFKKIAENIYLDTYGSHADLTIHKDKNLLKVLTDVGNPILAFGFETLSSKNIPYIKNVTKTKMISKYPAIVKVLRENGINLTGSFMFGFTGDSDIEAEEVMKFVQDNAINAYFTIYSVTPKSGLYYRLLEEYQAKYGQLKARGFEKSKILNRYLMQRNHFEMFEMEEIVLKAMKKYLFPSEGLDIPRLEGLAVARYYTRLGML